MNFNGYQAKKSEMTPSQRTHSERVTRSRGRSIKDLQSSYSKLDQQHERSSKDLKAGSESYEFKFEKSQSKISNFKEDITPKVQKLKQTPVQLLTTVRGPDFGDNLGNETSCLQIDANQNSVD